MPNIKLFGYGVNDENAISLVAKIKLMFNDWPCYDDMVITIVDSYVADLRGNPKPYIEVLDTEPKQGKKIAFRLKLAGYDVEFTKLNEFFAEPLYTIDEIEEEIKIILAPLKCQPIIVSLRLGDPLYASRAFRFALLEIKTPQFEVDELNQLMKMKLGALPDSRRQYVRWHQMLAILEDKS